MKLKGAWNAETEYNPGDVVQWTDGDVFVLKNPCATGVTPIDTMYWNKVGSPLADAVSMILDALELAKDEVEKYFINDQTLILKTGEGDEEKSYAVTVDDSGETPDVVAELIEDEEEGT